MSALALGLALLVAAGHASSGREDVEDLLRNGRIVSNTPVGQGITGASRAVLEYEGREVRALFKTVDEDMEAEYRYGREVTDHFRDSYQHEIAAYVLDGLMGLGLVPVSVAREIDGERGVLQQWIEDAVHRRTSRHAPPPERRSADQNVHAVRLLDYLIFNTDRHLRNIGFREGWRPMVIDHSIAFHALQVPQRPLHRFPSGPVARLRALDADKLEAALGSYLSREQLRALDARRRHVLEIVDAAIAERGAEQTLFDWP